MSRFSAKASILESISVSGRVFKVPSSNAVLLDDASSALNLDVLRAQEAGAADIVRILHSVSDLLGALPKK